MLAERARYLRDKWQDRPCPHSRMEKEYFKGERTRGQTCTSCGKEFTDREVNKLENRNRARRQGKANNHFFDRPCSS